MVSLDEERLNFTWKMASHSCYKTCCLTLSSATNGDSWPRWNGLSCKVKQMALCCVVLCYV